MSLLKVAHSELFVFLDALKTAICAVAYLKSFQKDKQSDVGFIMGKARLAPKFEPTIPWLELCAAVLAVEMADRIQDELDVKLDDGDSQVWMRSLIHNTTKRF